MSSLRNQHLVLRASLSPAARWGWVSTNVAAPAALGRRTTKARAAMAAADVRAIIEAGERFDAAAGLAFRLAAITGARRSELCALVYRDLDGDRLTIDSSIAIERQEPPPPRPRRRKLTAVVTQIEVDIPCDPTQIDHTGMPWAFLDEAAHQERIVERAIVVTGDSDDPVFACAASLNERPTGVRVHLEMLPGDPLEYVEAARRSHLLRA